jgi:GT2 family glycosyltransferase
VPTLSVIVVTHNSRAALERTLPALRAELRDGDELLVVDNASTDGSAEAAQRLVPHARVLVGAANTGFGAAANLGAEQARGELLVFLNPDARPAAGFADGIARPLERGYGWTAWQALVTSDDGATVNTSGGVVHFTGLAWTGELGVPAPGSLHAPRDVAFASGACLAVPADDWRRLGGFAPGMFMYHEDVELALRIRLLGGRVGAEPAAVVDHDYAFAKGAAKWRMLERNRWATILRTYPAPLLALLAPALVVAELGLLAAACAGGWAPAKLAAWADLARALPRLRRERRAVQAKAVVSAGEFAGALTARLDSPNLGPAARVPGLQRGLALYWWCVRLALGAVRG